MSLEQSLVKHILTNHSTKGRPVKDPSQAVNISVQPFITQLVRMVSVVTILLQRTLLC